MVQITAVFSLLLSNGLLGGGITLSSIHNVPHCIGVIYYYHLRVLQSLSVQAEQGCISSI